MFHRIVLLSVTLVPCSAFAQSTPRISSRVDGAAKDSITYTAAASGPSVEVSKTASVNGQNVCGVIRIKNTGAQTLAVSAIVDSLEVHFPRGVSPAALPAGSTPGWFKVADVPIALPGPIAPRASVAIEYCFSLCLAADSPGANSMRNVVAVTVTNTSGSIKTVTTRSISFPPPTLDCQACCLPDGDCADTVPDDCAAASGLSRGTGTDCATTECTQACCRVGETCADEGLGACLVDGGTPLGSGTTCATSECPQACCHSEGCSDETPSECQALGGESKGPGSFCRPFLTCLEACCLPNGSCQDVSESTCFGQDGAPQGHLTTCATSECPEACCHTEGCSDETPSACQALGGESKGPGSFCRPLLTCLEACCLPDGSCQDISESTCFGQDGTPQGHLTTCATSECPQPCCLDDGACADMAPSACFAAGGRRLDPDQARDCAEAATYGGCPQACCVQGHCNEFFPLECAIRQGELQGPGTVCTLDTCPRACCHDDDSCSDEIYSACEAAGGHPRSVHDINGQHIGIDCAILDSNYGGCSQVCCGFDPGSNFCNTIPRDTCISFGGFPQGATASCGQVGVCDGACCFGSECQMLHWSECLEQGGEPLHPGTECGIPGFTPCDVRDP